MCSFWPVFLRPIEVRGGLCVSASASQRPIFASMDSPFALCALAGITVATAGPLCNLTSLALASLPQREGPGAVEMPDAVKANRRATGAASTPWRRGFRVGVAARIALPRALLGGK